MPVVPTTSGRQVQSRGVQTGGFQTFDVPQAGQVLANVADQYAVAYGEARQKANVALSQVHRSFIRNLLAWHPRQPHEHHARLHLPVLLPDNAEQVQ